MRLFQPMLPPRPFVLVSKALPHDDLDAELSALENEDDENIVEVEDDKEPVEKAAGPVKYLRRWKVGNKWRYLYKNAQGHVSSKHMLPQEGHQHHVGEAFADGKGGHMTITHVEGEHVHVKHANGSEARMHKSDLHKHLSEVHKDAMDAYAKHGHERRQSALQKAKDIGSEKHIARAQKELDRFKALHGISDKQTKKTSVRYDPKNADAYAEHLRSMPDKEFMRAFKNTKGPAGKKQLLWEEHQRRNADPEAEQEPKKEAEPKATPDQKKDSRIQTKQDKGQHAERTKQRTQIADRLKGGKAVSLLDLQKELGLSRSDVLDHVHEMIDNGSVEPIASSDMYNVPVFHSIFTKDAKVADQVRLKPGATVKDPEPQHRDTAAERKHVESALTDAMRDVRGRVTIKSIADKLHAAGFDVGAGALQEHLLDLARKGKAAFSGHADSIYEIPQDERRYMVMMPPSQILRYVTGVKKEAVKKAVGHKFLRKYRRGAKWHYVYPPKKGKKTVSRHAAEATAIAANLIPDEGHQYQKGEMYSAGKGQGHWVVDEAKDGKVSVRNDETGETHHLTHAEFGNLLKESHTTEIQAHIENGLHKRESILESAKQIGSEKHIARAEAELKRWRDEHGIKESEPVNVTRTPQSPGEILIFDTERYDTGKKDSDGDPVMGFRQGPNVLAVVKDGLIVESSIPIDESLRMKINDRLFDIEGDREEGKAQDGTYIRDALDRSHPSLWIHPHKDWTPKHFIPKFPVTSPPTEQPVTPTIQKEKLPEVPKPEPVATPTVSHGKTLSYYETHGGTRVRYEDLLTDVLHGLTSPDVAYEAIEKYTKDFKFSNRKTDRKRWTEQLEQALKASKRAVSMDEKHTPTLNLTPPVAHITIDTTAKSSLPAKRLIKRMAEFASKEESHAPNGQVYYDGEQFIASDGYRMIVMRSDVSPQKVGGIPNEHSWKNGAVIPISSRFSPEDASSLPPPNFHRMIPAPIPSRSFTVSSEDIAKLAAAAKAAALYWEEPAHIQFNLQDDGTLSFQAETMGEKGYSSGIGKGALHPDFPEQPPAYRTLALDPRYLADAARGVGQVTIQWPETPVSPARIDREDGETHVIMPMRSKRREPISRTPSTGLPDEADIPALRKRIAGEKTAAPEKGKTQTPTPEPVTPTPTIQKEKLPETPKPEPVSTPAPQPKPEPTPSVDGLTTKYDPGAIGAGVLKRKLSALSPEDLAVVHKMAEGHPTVHRVVFLDKVDDMEIEESMQFTPAQFKPQKKWATLSDGRWVGMVVSSKPHGTTAPTTPAPSPTPAPVTRKVYVDSGDRLSNSGFHRSGGKGSGAAHWWLRDSAGNFLPIPRVRGDENFRYNLHLPPGTYTLGTGKGRDAIRTDVVVKPLTQAEQQSVRAKTEAGNQIMNMIMGGNANPAAQAAVQEGLTKARQQGKEQEFAAAIQQKVEQTASDEGVGVGDALTGYGILSAIGSVLGSFFDA